MFRAIPQDCQAVVPAYLPSAGSRLQPGTRWGNTVAISTTAPEISALELARALQLGNDLQIIDVRTPAAVAAGRIDMVPADRYHNIVGSHLLRRRTLDGTGVDATRPIAVICRHGHDSAIVAGHLNEIGCHAHSLRGGMAAWMLLVVGRAVTPPPSLDRLVQFERPGNGALGYLLASNGEALIVDPPRDPAPYLDAARETGTRLAGVADTHLHADYISGAPTLARTLHVPYYLHARDTVSPYDGAPGRLDVRAVADGDIIRVGRCGVRVLHTPGHTEGSVCYVIDDAIALTGDFLFVASVGRPDLAGKTEPWTQDLWQSMAKVRRTWRSDVLVCPAHYGSPVERRADGVIAAPFGQLLHANEALQHGDRDAFAQWVLARSGSFPDSYRTIKMINLGLSAADAQTAEDLEIGHNRCALSS